MANKAGKRLLKSWQKINLRIKLIILKVAKLHLLHTTSHLLQTSSTAVQRPKVKPLII